MSCVEVLRFFVSVVESEKRSDSYLRLPEVTPILSGVALFDSMLSRSLVLIQNLVDVESLNEICKSKRGR